MQLKSFPIFFRLEGEAYTHYKSMLISLALHLILLMFELLVCDKLESGRHLWILVFIPLIFISIVSIAVCIWAVKHDRSFEVMKTNFDIIIELNNFIILAGAVLCNKCIAIYISCTEIRWFYCMVMGSSVYSFVDCNVLVSSKF